MRVTVGCFVIVLGLSSASISGCGTKTEVVPDAGAVRDADVRHDVYVDSVSGVDVLSAEAGSQTDAGTQGLALLEACDIRAAHALLGTVAGADVRPEVGLGFVLTDLILLAEDPVLEELRPRLGFDRPGDTAFAWKVGGLLDQLTSKTADCDDVESYARSHGPHPSLREDTRTSRWYERVDPTLTFADLRASAERLLPRFERVARVLERSAAQTRGSVVLAGGCGIGQLRFQPPELFALAAAFDAVRFAVVMSRGYDANIGVRITFADYYRTDAEKATFVDQVNAALLQLRDAAQVRASKEILVGALGLTRRALEAARTANVREPGILLDYTAVPPLLFSDVDAFLTASERALTPGVEKVAIPLVSPTIEVRGNSFFDDPFDFSRRDGRFLTLEQSATQGGLYVRGESDTWQDLLGARLDPSPFGPLALDYTWERNSGYGLSEQAWRDIYDPGHRWTGTYTCE